jgi:hypothetical protein
MLLVSLGLMTESENIDNLFYSAEKQFSFGSVVRCSISVKSDSGYTEDLKKIIATFSGDSCSSKILNNCINNYLSQIPKGTIVVLLGMDKEYINETKNIFGSLYKGLRKINALSYTDGERTWVHVAHPSGRLTDKQFTAWVNADNKSKNAHLVQSAIREHKVKHFA